MAWEAASTVDCMRSTPGPRDTATCAPRTRWARVARCLRDVALVALMTLGLARMFGRVTLPPAGTDLLVRSAAWFGLYGVEDVTDFYVAVTFGLSLAVSVAAVWWASRRWGRGPRVNAPGYGLASPRCLRRSRVA